MSKVLEYGDVYFLYWPAEGEERVEGLQDVQRFFMVLKPDDEDVYRRLIVGQKKLPEAGGEARYWGFVDKVVHGRDEALEAFRREAGLGGPPARPAGEGVYAIVRHEGHTDLAYALDLPEEPGEAQRDLHIEKEAAYLLSIKNPEAGAPPGAGLEPERKPDLPDELRARFGDRRWTSADPPRFLDFEGTEFLLVAGREGVPEDVGDRLHPERERAEARRLLDALREVEGGPADKPLLEGEWR